MHGIDYVRRYVYLTCNVCTIIQLSWHRFWILPVTLCALIIFLIGGLIIAYCTYGIMLPPQKLEGSSAGMKCVCFPSTPARSILTLNNAHTLPIVNSIEPHITVILEQMQQWSLDTYATLLPIELSITRTGQSRCLLFDLTCISSHDIMLILGTLTVRQTLLIYSNIYAIPASHKHKQRTLPVLLAVLLAICF
jgi:hypothetical protein